MERLGSCKDFVAGLGVGGKDESKQGPGVLHHARELDFEFRGQWEGSEGILSNDDDVDSDNHAAAHVY